MTEERVEFTDTEWILAAFICFFLSLFFWLHVEMYRIMYNSLVLESDLKLHLKCIHKVVFREKNNTVF